MMVHWILLKVHMDMDFPLAEQALPKYAQGVLFLVTLWEATVAIRLTGTSLYIEIIKEEFLVLNCAHLLPKHKRHLTNK